MSGSRRCSDDDPGPRPLGEVRVVGEAGRRLLVQLSGPVEVQVVVVLGPNLDELFDEDAERATPIADVVLADDVMTEEPEHANHGVTDHGAPQVTDVQLFGDVRGRIVDEVAPGWVGGDAEPVVAGDAARASC